MKIHEQAILPFNGLHALALQVMFAVAAIAVGAGGLPVALSLLLLVAAVYMFWGYCIVQTGEALLLMHLGDYRGTVKKPGFYWVLPFSKKQRLSLKTRISVIEDLATHDRQQQPLLLSASVEWQVLDTAIAHLAVENPEKQAKILLGTALQWLASRSVLQGGGNAKKGMVLKGQFDAAGKLLEEYLQKDMRGIGLQATRITLVKAAYAPEVTELLRKKRELNLAMSAGMQWVQKAPEMAGVCLQEMEKRGLLNPENTEARQALAAQLAAAICQAGVKP